MHLWCLHWSGQTALAPPHDNPGYCDTNEVQGNQYCHKDQHRRGIRCGRKNGREKGDDQNGVTKILDQELRGDDSKNREKENQDGQFKDETEAEENHEDQIEILVDANERNDWSLETDQEAQQVGQRNKIAEGDSGEKKKNRGEEESGD